MSDPIPFEPFNRVKSCRHGTFVYNVHDMYIGRSLDVYGEFSEGEVEVFRQVVQPGWLALEVGANIGAHTIPLARLVGGKGRVLAFEPQRLIFQTLCANLSLNSIPNVYCWHAAAGETVGATFVPLLDCHQEQNFGGLGLQPGQRGEKVTLLTIDSLRLSHCHFIKIDVEGMEQDVLQGARDTIARCQPIVYVENDRKEKSAAVIRLIDSLGYDMYWHTPPLFNPQNYAGNPQNIFGRIVSINMLCCPKNMAQNIVGLARVQVP